MSAIDAIGEYLEDVVYRSVCKAMTEVAPKTKVEEREEEEVYISIKQACEFLGIKTTAFYERLKGDSIRTKKEEGRRTVCLNDLKKLMETKAIGRYARFKGKI